MNVTAVNPSSVNPPPRYTSLGEASIPPIERLRQRATGFGTGQVVGPPQNNSIDPYLPGLEMNRGTVAPRRAVKPASLVQESTILQLWEGEVLEIDNEQQTMRVVLKSMIGGASPHAGEIDLSLVSEQDLELVKPGAVFYLTLSNRIRSSSIKNEQELRFRRLPSWSKAQVTRLGVAADRLLSKMRTRPTA